MRILLAGVSVRALAQSAERAGHEVACLDYFGDRDLPGKAPKVSMSGSGCEMYEPTALANLADRLDYDALAYVASLENHPEVVARIAGNRPIVGNSPETLERVRDWSGLASFCRKVGVDMPRTLAEDDVSAIVENPGEWLLKPVKGGGGHSITTWSGEMPNREWYIQRRVYGVPASAVFEADGERCRVLGASEQLIGLDRFGATDFRYCGNLYPLNGADNGNIGSWIEETTNKLTAHFGLRGVNGLDFVIPPIGNPILIEVNPRPPASAELMELALGKSIFSAHLHPLAEQAGHQAPTDCVHGKAIVYARRDVAVPDTDSWAGAGRRDIPGSGEMIAGGHPVCTVFASGQDRRDCLDRLGEAADAVRSEIGDRATGLEQ